MDKTVKSFIACDIIDTQLQQQIINLDESIFPQPWKPHQWLDIFSKTDYILSLIFEDKELAGLSLTGLSSVESLGHLYKIMILERLRGSTAAQRLFDELSRSLKAEKMEKIFLEVSVLNSQAIAFYEKQGFEQLNRVRNFYSNSEDAFAMHKYL